MAKEDYQFVVAADIGTAYTKVSWAPKRYPENLHVYNGWPASKDQVPTAVLYRPVAKGRETEWEMHAFGQQAMDTYFQDEEADGFALFRNFKTKLHSQEKFGEAVEVEGDYRTIDGRTKVVRSLTLPALKIFSDILQHLEVVILQRLGEAHGSQFTSRDIEWVLTVPAMWTASARDFMRQAARKAKIYENIKPRQLAIALEPESAALHVRSLRQTEQYKEEILNAKLYIVVDIGGGTIDIAVHKVYRHDDTGDEYIHEIKGRMGSDRGATCIDRAFEHFLCSLNVDGYPNFFKEMKQDPKLWGQLMCKFEAGKTSFDGSRDMRIELPRRIFDSYKEKTSKDLASVLSEGAGSKVFIKSSTSDYLRVSKDICRTWYRPTIDSVVKQVQSLHKKYEANALFVVGGFAECVILKEELKAKFPDLYHVIPPLPGLAVIKGAVQYGPHPKAIASRVSHATYGVACSRAFIEGTHDPSKKIWCERYARHNCNNIFSVFVKIGDEVNPAKPYTQSFNTLGPSTKDMTMDIYATDEKNPMYVTDPGCKRIGKMTIPVEPLPAGVKAKDDYREVTVQMDFSGSEIFVSSVDDSGKHCKERTLDFLPVKEYSAAD